MLSFTLGFEKVDEPKVALIVTMMKSVEGSVSRYLLLSLFSFFAIRASTKKR
jgi:hypothetical protein